MKKINNIVDLNVTILYGSETGTAQDIAEQIWKHTKRFDIKSNVNALDEYNINHILNEKILIFVVSTAGQGDTPKNMKNFWKFLLQRSLSSNFLANINFSVFGLGDSSFKKFNFAAKKLNKRLIQLGGSELLSIGLADDQHDLGIDAVFDPWLENLFEKICEKFYLPKKPFLEKFNIIERFNLNISEQEKNFEETNDAYLYEAITNKSLILGTVLENVRITSKDHFQDVRLIKFKGSNLIYSPGDIAYVKAKNSDDEVNKFFKILHLHGAQANPDAILRFSEKDIKLPFILKQKLSLRQVAQQYWDLNFKPKRSTLHVLACLSENNLEKEKLIELSTYAVEEFYNYVIRPKRNIVEVLNDFPHTTSKLNIQRLFEFMSPIKPRAFSVASSLKYSPDEIHLLVAVVRYKTQLIEPRFGLCSKWLASLKPGENAVFEIVKGTFKFDYQKPMILVGPGTGIAPFRAVLLDQVAKKKNLSFCLLFFGCRNKEKDYHCKEDLSMLAEDYNLKIFCAFSRDQREKIYVQHIIAQQGQRCWNFLKVGGQIYVSGSSKNMPNAVREEFINLVKKHGKMSEERAQNYIENLEKKEKYQAETW